MKVPKKFSVLLTLKCCKLTSTLKVIFLQDLEEPGKLILVASDGIQHPPVEFPPGGMLQFLSCLESSLESQGGRLDPSLSTLEEQNSNFKRLEATSADVSKAKKRFPWFKKEVSLKEQRFLLFSIYRQISRVFKS